MQNPNLTSIPKEISDKLLSYQIEHTIGLVYSLKTYNRGLDASDTGTGKTYASIAAAATLGLKPFIVCPKSVISSWLDVIKHFGIESYGVSNYEQIKNCKYYPPNSPLEPIKFPYIDRLEGDDIKKLKEGKPKELPKKTRKSNINKKIMVSGKNINNEEKKYTYKWNLPNDLLLIFDEAHRSKNRTTCNSLLLYTAAKCNVKILILSATVSDSPENFILAGYVLGLYKSIRDGHAYIKSHGQEYQNVMSGIYDKLYPEYASRMRIRDLGKLFPDNQVIAECFDMETRKEIEEQYKIIEAVVEELKKQEERTTSIGQLQKARQRIELLKAATFIELAKKFLAEGSSVAIFVNFTMTLEHLAEQLGTKCVIHGKQTLQERNQHIANFNSDKERVIVANVRAGGVGISLHDKHGNYPRVSLISPSWSAQDVIQALGRIHRANCKTPVRQRIIFCKGTVEEDICKNMKEKIENIANLNDGDLGSYKIEGLIEEEPGIDMNSGLSEFDKVFQRINVLHAKRDRLKQDLVDTEKEIAELQDILQKHIE